MIHAGRFVKWGLLRECEPHPGGLANPKRVRRDAIKLLDFRARREDHPIDRETFVVKLLRAGVVMEGALDRCLLRPQPEHISIKRQDFSDVLNENRVLIIGKPLQPRKKPGLKLTAGLIKRLGCAAHCSIQAMNAPSYVPVSLNEGRSGLLLAKGCKRRWLTPLFAAPVGMPG